MPALIMNKLFVAFCLIALAIGCKKPDVTIPAPNPPAQDSLPVVTTNNISGLSQFSVTLNARLVDTGRAHVTELGIVIDTLPHPTTSRNVNKLVAQQPGSDGSFSRTVTYVPSRTTFYLRAYAINAYGTAYGNEVSFTSLLQKVFTGHVHLSTQQEVVDFGAQHYTVIDGDLIINGSVNDLTPLLGLAIVNNSFNVNRTLLTNFRGLDSLEITGARFANNFFVEYNDNLINFEGLSKLKITRGWAQISHNDALLTLDGLDSYVAASAGSLRIGECPALQHINGLSKLQFVGSDVYIINNASLTNITGLSSLSDVRGRLYIENNPVLHTLDGLEKIESLPTGIEINNNATLQDLNGIRYLRSISSDVPTGTIKLHNNPMVTSLAAFSNITFVDYVEISNCGALPNLTGLHNIDSIFSLTIDGNAGLTSLTGLEKLATLSRLQIVSNPALLNLQGLSRLTRITANDYSITIARNNSLQSLTGLENLARADGSIQISFNPGLTDFCPLKPLFTAGYSGWFALEGNAANPTQSEVVTNCN